MLAAQQHRGHSKLWSLLVPVLAVWPMRLPGSDAAPAQATLVGVLQAAQYRLCRHDPARRASWSRL